MGAFAPALAVAPLSGKIKVPVVLRNRDKPVVKSDKVVKQKRIGIHMWQRHLPFKLVGNNSHIGPGLVMEADRKEPDNWKDPKRKLRFEKPTEKTVAFADKPKASAMPTHQRKDSSDRQPKKASKKGKAAAAPANKENATTNKENAAPAAKPAGVKGLGGVAKTVGLGGVVKGLGAKVAAAPAPAPAPAPAAEPAAAPAAALAAAASVGPAAPSAAPAASNAAAAKPAAADPAAADALLCMLQAQSFEVECSLRPPLNSSAAVQAAIRGVADARALDDELTSLARSTGVLKGRIFQGLLECLRAQGAAHAQLDNSAKKQPGGNVATELGLTTPEWQSLADRADALRKLVRIKVADDNDLKTARQGLELCARFFEGLAQLLELRQREMGEIGAAATEYDVLQSIVLAA